MTVYNPADTVLQLMPDGIVPAERIVADVIQSVASVLAELQLSEPMAFVMVGKLLVFGLDKDAYLSRRPMPPLLLSLIWNMPE